MAKNLHNGKGNGGGKRCYNCQAGLHGKCSMPWCICEMPECERGYHKVSPIEVAIGYFLTRDDKKRV